MSRGLAGPSAGGVWRCAPGPTKRADRPESASATCAVTKRPRGPVVGQLVDTFTIKSILSPDPACATSGQAETLKKLYAGDAAETVWGDQNLSNRAPR